MIKSTVRLLLCILMCAVCTRSFAQQKSFSNVLTIQLRNMGAIYNKNQVSGYYMFYKVDRVNGKTNSYLLRILDQNLNEVSESKIEESKYFYLMEAAYNDESLMFKFYDAKEKTISFYQYDNKSQLKNKSSRKLESKMEVYTYNSQAEREESDGTFLFAIPGQGFVDYGMKKDGKLGYAITFYPENKTQKGWTYESASNSKEVENAGYVVASKNLLISSVIRRNNLLSQNFEAYLLGIDINTGKKLFEKKVEDKQYELSFINATIDENSGNVALLGQYYKKNDNVVKDKSLGLCSYVLSSDGNIITKNYASWLTDVRKFLPVNAQGKMEDVGYLYFHKIIKTADGRYIAVGEQYRKAASAAGIALTVLGGSSAGVTKMVIEDLVVLEFNQQFKLENVKIFDKSKTNVELPAAYDFAGPQITAYYLKALGHFDYSFSQQNEDATTFSVGYVDYEKKKGEKNGLVFGAITYAEKEYATDKLSLETDASSLRVIPAKPGFILITEYFRKAKKLDMRLEKINY
ncbi:hypothetical protein GXP67_18970 [Rhodocytophaga rosea]|uniref:WG repeat-containing protein n=1 Tax=Rhodocytophaga rosea TaxID=2704465 RepID=A0A6C0GKN9_9BACT|nr:DUF6770 family protein [Rhodocytophaga rosea]QHT68578.1 hypothetical protein GXP67_18970 [Rhodocytophaga rosea]